MSTAAAAGVGVGKAGVAPPPAYSYLQAPAHMHSQVPPVPPVRDSSSLKGVRVGPGHEKFPSWPGSADQPAGARPAPGGGSHRSKSWTDHTNYPKEKAITYSRPYMKRPSPAFTQQLKTVMERCEKIPPETYLSRVDSSGDCDYNAPSPPERDKPQLTQADLDEYARTYQEVERQVAQPQQADKQLTQRDLEEYARAYSDPDPQAAAYAQSEGYHSYVSSSDSSTTTPFLDRLRRDSAARPQAMVWDEPPERDGGSRGGGGGRCDSVVTTSSGSASSSETLKWHGSLSDVSVASSGAPPAARQLIIAHSARVQTPQRHHSESVLYLGNTNKLRLFPVNTYTVQPGDGQQQQQPPSPPQRSMSLSSPTQPSLSVAERISELERQQQQQQTRYTYLDPEKRHRVSDPTLKAIQKKALLSFYERHHSGQPRNQAWRSEPQLAPQQPPPHSPPPPQPPPRPRPAPSSHSSRRASFASDYAGGSWREIASTREIIINESGSIKDGPRHQYSSSCGSLSTDLLGPLIMGPSISVDDWVPERPPKKPHLRAAFPQLLQDRVPSPDLPPPSPPPVVDDEVFASDEPLPPPPPDIHVADNNSTPSSSKLLDQKSSENVPEGHKSREVENENLRIPERTAKPQVSFNGNVALLRQVDSTHCSSDSTSCQKYPPRNNSTNVYSEQVYHNLETAKQAENAVINRHSRESSLSPNHSDTLTHGYSQNGTSSERYQSSAGQRQHESSQMRLRMHENYKSQRYPDQTHRSTSSLPRHPEHHWNSHMAAQRHSDINLHHKCNDSTSQSHRTADTDFQNYRNSDTIHRYPDLGSVPHRCCGEGNNTLPRNHEYRNFCNKHAVASSAGNNHPDTNQMHRHLDHRYGSQRHGDFAASQKSSERGNFDSQKHIPPTEEHSVLTNDFAPSKRQPENDKDCECNCNIQRQNDNMTHRNSHSSDHRHEKLADNDLQRNNRLSPRKSVQESFSYKHARSNSIGNKCAENDSSTPRIPYSNNRIVKHCENGVTDYRNGHTNMTTHYHNSENSANNSKLPENSRVIHNQPEVSKTMPGHFEREYHEKSVQKTADGKHLLSSRSFDNGTQQRQKQEAMNISQRSFDNSGSTQRHNDSNITSQKYSVLRSQHTTNTPVYKNTSHMYTRPQPLKPFEITNQNHTEMRSSSNSVAQKTMENWSSSRCSTQKLVVNGKLAAPLNNSRAEPEWVTGSSSMPAKARLQRLPLIVPSNHSQETVSRISPGREKDPASPTSPPVPDKEAGSPTHQPSTSKASYLAYRRERAERSLPNFEGSYKRTMSPSGGQAPLECDRLSMPERVPAPEPPSPTSQQVAEPEGPASPEERDVPPAVPDTGPPPDSGDDPSSKEEDSVSRSDSVRTTRSDPEARCEDSATESTRAETESQQSGSLVTEQQLQLVQRSEVVLRVNAATSDAASQTELEEAPVLAAEERQQQQQQQPHCQQQQRPLPSRRKLQEEIDCERLSLDLASKLPPTDKLHGILVPAPDHKKPTDYVSGLFRIEVTTRPRGVSETHVRSQGSQSNSSESSTNDSSSSPICQNTQQSTEDSFRERDRNSNPVIPLPATSAYFTTSESKAKFLTQYGRDMSQLNGLNDNKELHQKKEELMLRLDRKLEVLRGEHLVVREECRVNDELGESVAAQVSRLARPHEAAKYRLHVEEVGKITSLLLALSGRLARAENALMGLPDNHTDRKILESKRDKLIEQLEEAKKLKESIDKRSINVSNILNKYFNPEEYADYDHFINMKAKLLMDSKEIADKIKLGEEQLAALRETLFTPD